MESVEKTNADMIKEKLRKAFSDGPFAAFVKTKNLSWSGEPVDVYAND